MTRSSMMRSQVNGKSEVPANLQHSFAVVDFFCTGFAAIPLQATGVEDRNTLSHTHFSQSCRVARLSTLNLHTHMRVAQDVRRSCVVPLRTQNRHISQSVSQNSAYLTPSRRFLLASQTTPTSRPLTGIRSTPCATSLQGRQSGHLAEPLRHTRLRKFILEKSETVQITARVTKNCFYLDDVPLSRVRNR